MTRSGRVEDTFNMKALRVGIAGYGVVGKRRHACIDRHPDLKVVAVCDRTFSEEKTLEGEHMVRRYKDYHRLIKEDLDILLVCLTNDIAPEASAQIVLNPLDMPPTC